MTIMRRLGGDKIIESISGQRVVFHHIPKCGGTSIGKALRRRYPLSSARLPVAPAFQAIRLQHPNSSSVEQNLLVDDFFHFRLLKLLYEDIRCVVGHVRFSNVAYKQFGDSYKFATTLREPIALMLSQFEFQRAIRSDLWKKEYDLERYLDSEEAYRMGSVMPYFLSGLPTSADPRSSESVDLAKENLTKFAVVGFVEDMAGFERRMNDALSVRLRIGHANKSSSGGRKENLGLSQQLYRKLEQISEANVEVYNFARAELGKSTQSAQ
jgi:hypothetical protein